MIEWLVMHPEAFVLWWLGIVAAAAWVLLRP